MNKFKKIYKALVLLIAAFALYSCSEDDGNSSGYVPISAMPPHFPAIPAATGNPLTAQGVALGKKLFFDVRLSGNNGVSCSSCHLPYLAFSDGVALSNAGISGQRLLRNAPALINLAWATNGLFWDGGASNLESQAFAPLAHADEMYQNLDELLMELEADSEYPVLFDQAFGAGITQSGIVRALAQYQRTLISGNSAYDDHLLGEQARFTAEEKAGLALAEQFCFSCHTGVLLTDNSYHNNGIDDDFSDISHERMFQGRYRVTYDPADLGRYKPPTLRNVSLTGPYMHDGRFSSLEEVVAFYASGIKPSATLDPLLPSGGFSFTVQEQRELVAFLKTLTDDAFVNQ